MHVCDWGWQLLSYAAEQTLAQFLAPVSGTHSYPNLQDQGGVNASASAVPAFTCVHPCSTCIHMYIPKHATKNLNVF